MSERIGLRERKKQQTRRAISEAAIALFLERGFDKVSVADVAAVADVSTVTVFNYFPTKEDLVLHRFEDHVDDLVAVVRGRRSGESAVAAVRRHFLDGLERRDALAGLDGRPHVLAFQRMVLAAPGLRLRVLDQAMRSVDALAAVLAEEAREEAREESGEESGGAGGFAARTAAAQLCAVRTELVRENVRRLAEGEEAEVVHADAVAAAERAFAQLEHGLGGYCVRP
ncbi:TetR family transcriptional regulator [Streptomyces sp. NRRL WC-3742]|uniref:TetR family transcriptional regulator n=1 Tax=Streptomyces sp. NRRL WC-3742 TaxID=1463934 RepID=UPI00056528D3|nr:TetR family transcriptional regulator [Streptomyces sp. NRRL WC-3742]